MMSSGAGGRRPEAAPGPLGEHGQQEGQDGQ